MDYNLQAVCCTEISAAVLILMLQLCRKSAIIDDKYGDKLLNVFLWIVFYFSLIEMFSYFLIGVPGQTITLLSWVMDCLCFIGTGTAGIIWALYVDYRLYASEKRLKKLSWLFIPYALEMLLIVITPITGFVFNLVENNEYVRGPFIGVTYVVPIFYIMFSLAEVFVVSSKKPSYKFYPFVYFALLAFLGMGLQILFYGVPFVWLCIAIAVTMVFIQLQTELRFRDPMTGMFNRGQLYFMLSAALEGKKSFYGIMADIDDFKKINDTWGHNVGDRAICQTAKILNESAGNKWIAIRYAGDEFILISSEADEKDVEELIKTVNNTFIRFNGSSNEPYKLSVSIGSSFIKAGNDNIEKFIQEMDQKMYEQKNIRYSEKNA